MSLMRKPNDFFPSFFDSFGKDFFDDFMPFNSDRTLPAVNIVDDKDEYRIEVAAPGLNKEDFKVNVDKGLLTVSYEKKEATESTVKIIRKEFTNDSFKRSFNLDEKINADNIEAKYENGILNIFLPKKEEIKIEPKQISIQ